MNYGNDYSNDSRFDCSPCYDDEVQYDDPWIGEEPEAFGPCREYTPRELGLRGEEVAARYLAHRGFTILERNWACPFGEADIIALGPDDDELVFIEVKTRSTKAKGLPEEAVGPSKRRRYESIALAYLRDSDFSNISICFDVIAISMADGERAILRHHHRAFDMGD